MVSENQRLNARVGLDLDRASLQRAQQALSDIDRNLDNINSASTEAESGMNSLISSIATGATVLAAFGSSLQSAIDRAAGITELSLRFGIAAEEIQAISPLFRELGFDIETSNRAAAQAVAELDRRISDLSTGVVAVTPNVQNAFDTLGISLETFVGLNSQQRIEVFIQGLQQLNEEQRRTVTNQLLGARAGNSLIGVVQRLAEEQISIAQVQARWNLSGEETLDWLRDTDTETQRLISNATVLHDTLITLAARGLLPEPLEKYSGLVAQISSLLLSQIGTITTLIIQYRTLQAVQASAAITGTAAGIGAGGLAGFGRLALRGGLIGAGIGAAAVGGAYLFDRFTSREDVSPQASVTNYNVQNVNLSTPQTGRVVEEFVGTSIQRTAQGRP